VYRDISPRYLSVSDYLNYQGTEGVSIYGRQLIGGRLGITAFFENYFQSYANDFYEITNSDYHVNRSRVRLNILQLGLVRPSLTFFRNNGLNYNSTGYTLDLSQIEIIPRKLIYYYELSPWKYNFNGLESIQVYNKSGLRHLVNNWCNLRLEHVSDVRYIQNGPDTNPHGYNFIAHFGEFNVPKTKIQTDFSYWFQNRKNSQDTLDKNRHAVKVSFHQSVTPDFYWYLNGVFAQENTLREEWEAEHGRDGYFYYNALVQSEVSGGLIYQF
jgi:hypothetical protein